MPSQQYTPPSSTSSPAPPPPPPPPPSSAPPPHDSSLLTLPHPTALIPPSVDPSLSPPPTILVTGANGLIASHLCHQLLLHGYRVRGAVRDARKHAWLTAHFASFVCHDNDENDNDASNNASNDNGNDASNENGNDASNENDGASNDASNVNDNATAKPKKPTPRFELVQVPDMRAPGAFDEAVRGVEAVAHVASVMLGAGGDHPVRDVVGGTVEGARRVLEAVQAQYEAGRRAEDGAAAPAPGVRRVVFTSSAVAVRDMEAFHDRGNGSETLGAVEGPGEWNVGVVEAVEGGRAEGLPAGGAERVMMAYAAGKTMAEREVWAWAAGEGARDGVVVNTVVPAGVFGRPLSHEHQGYPSSSQWAPKAFTGDPDFKQFPNFYWINIKDMARLHVAALVHPGVVNERIFGFAGTYTMNEFLAFYRKHYPDREFPADIPGLESDLVEVKPAKRAEEILKGMGRPGFETLEDTVMDNIIDIA
ncbi:aldehyde reductase protein [Diplodia corticola]|uniref:Aldehyde reductase protein n=1 Tax=Diplodia corticola TaxID=236234 RepID=A0A1J9RAM6_9PEZI|nr:aldehyde reductase protein [Diplodia corticola]OJD38654.1 aldehyde reductase protein [Diplodia corticola]